MRMLPLIFEAQKISFMKTRYVFFLALLISFLISCSRALTPVEAASGKYKKCRPVK